MALEGTIREFGLADILQLLFYQKKTGVLIVEGHLDRVRLYFKGGNIVATQSSKRPEDNRMGRILIKKGVLKKEELTEVLNEQKQTGTPLGGLLIRKNLAPRDMLVDIITRQIIDQVVHMFSWKEGTYEFIPQEFPVDEDLGISMDTQYILMEGLKVVDEWSIIEGILTLDTVFSQTDKVPAIEEITEDERYILSFVDGENDVSIIVDLSDKDDFVVSKTLVSLLEKGLISPVEKAEEITEEVPEKKTYLPRIMAIVIPFIIILFLAISMVFSLRRSEAIYKNLIASKRLEYLRLSIEAFRAQKGHFPDKLTVEGIADPWGNTYYYSLNDSGYKLSSAGPDKKPDTDDDIY